MSRKSARSVVLVAWSQQDLWGKVFSDWQRPHTAVPPLEIDVLDMNAFCHQWLPLTRARRFVMLPHQSATPASFRFLVHVKTASQRKCRRLSLFTQSSRIAMSHPFVLCTCCLANHTKSYYLRLALATVTCTPTTSRPNYHYYLKLSRLDPRTRSAVSVQMLSSRGHKLGVCSGGWVAELLLLVL
jgi:hypothetical protein